MTTEYNYLLQTSQWYQKRSFILQRDGNKCRNCGDSDSLIVHHRQYHIKNMTGKFISPWEYENRHLITLCEKCHHLGHLIYKIPTFII